MSAITIFFIFAFGLCVGSFLNVVINRIETGEDIVKKPSHCPKCGHKLAFYELVPVFSFLALSGKCAKCGQKISWQYPVIEVLTAFIFLSVFYFYSPQIFSFKIQIIYALVIFSLFVIISAYDFKHYEIPDGIIYLGISVSLAYDLYFYWWQDLKYFLLAGILPAAFFLSLIIFSKGEWMGMGDVKLALLIGFFLGAAKSAVAFLLAFWSGAIIGIFLLLLKKKGIKSQLPFGPFLVLGALSAFFFGEKLISAYLQILF